MVLQLLICIPVRNIKNFLISIVAVTVSKSSSIVSKSARVGIWPTEKWTHQSLTKILTISLPANEITFRSVKCADSVTIFVFI